VIEWVKVIILGIVEGITEFLPISSTGHLIVAAALLNFQGSIGGTFEIFIQLGAVVAVIVYFRSNLIQQARTVATEKGTQQFWLGVIVAFIPAAVIGFLLKDWIKEVLFSPSVVAISLIIGGIIFLIIERRPVVSAANSGEATDITPRQAFIVGIAQIVALIPGTSRSGASIVGGMLAGLNRRAATQFSFYLAIPTLGVATIYDLLTSLDEINSDQIAMLVVGAIVAGIVAWISIGWLLRYVSTNTFLVFGYYRIAAGVIILLLVAANVIT
jgi:undecaprenyl-diphosphatase